MSQRRTRLIARLDVKGKNLIKGVQLEGLRVVGDPQTYATGYYETGIDELIYMDVVASLYQRNNLADVVLRATENIFVPLTVGGGIRSPENVETLLRAGADKIAINTAAVRRPELITELSRMFGSQCIVLSIEAKRQGEAWEAYTDNGRERTGIDAVQWARRGEELGAGEILVTSVDMEGRRRGFDVELVCEITRQVDIPVIASGGMGEAAHLLDVVERGGADAVAMAHVLHHEVVKLPELRNALVGAGLSIRNVDWCR
ncbi:imidazole glycerol phosphate synthase subunit HisF [Minwuia thermotolerans]|uniref:Imidazole glycerol phosphate synthase subunit HisF n=1 Tax=Minwuia thermotolerans TaxID=2056226 RepID=A0A2M9G675_9PROT|nr:imidazole glycerol phosphate synthase cyclase subunit [Minwuia thermotolerans]PJK31211.1 imidazole glycerol phosphate synthase subunit HisF [Minwuia thermotolerans]